MFPQNRDSSLCIYCTQTEINPEEENKLAGAESQVNEVRVQYTAPEEQGFSDQDEAASGGKDNYVSCLISILLIEHKPQ